MWFFHKWESIKEVFSNIDLGFEFGDKKIYTKHRINQEIEESARQKEFVQQISEVNLNNDSENTIKEIRKEFGKSKNKASQKCKECNKEKIEKEKAEFLDVIYKVYGKYSGNELEKLTHSEKPWINAREGCSPWERSTQYIKDEDIIDYYGSK